MLIRLLAFALLGWHATASACTTFELNDHQRVLTAKRFDFYTDLALITTHVRGLKRTALTHQKFQGSPVSWTSQYGSVTFAIMGTEFPVEGMNEAGLVVESLHNYGTTFPSEKRVLPYINNRQLVQYLLDRAGSFDEAVKLVQGVYVQPLIPHDQHFFVCDSKGSCGIIEYIKGQLVITAKNHLAKPLITNYPYEDSIQGKPDLSGDTRYTRAATLLSQPYGQTNAIDYAFSVMDQIALKKDQGGSMTGWEVVYDQSNRTIHFFSDEAPQQKWISVGKIDFSPQGKALMMDVHYAQGGDVTEKLAPFDRKLDVGYIRNFMYGFGKSLEKDYPGITESIISYPSMSDQPAVVHF